MCVVVVVFFCFFWGAGVCLICLLVLGDRGFNTDITVNKEGNVLFNDALNTFYLRLYGVGHMVKYQPDSKR